MILWDKRCIYFGQKLGIGGEVGLCVTLAKLDKWPGFSQKLETYFFWLLFVSS